MAHKTSNNSSSLNANTINTSNGGYIVGNIDPSSNYVSSNISSSIGSSWSTISDDLFSISDKVYTDNALIRTSNLSFLTEIEMSETTLETIINDPAFNADEILSAVSEAHREYSEEFLTKYTLKLNWNAVSKNAKLTEANVDNHFENINFVRLSENKNFKFTKEFILKYADYLDINEIMKSHRSEVDESFLEYSEFFSNFDFSVFASICAYISEDKVFEYLDKWDFDKLKYVSSFSPMYRQYKKKELKVYFKLKHIEHI